MSKSMLKRKKKKNYCDVETINVSKKRELILSLNSWNQT